jgi:hypothetical protein
MPGLVIQIVNDAPQPIAPPTIDVTPRREPDDDSEVGRNSERFVAAVEQDRDKLAFKFKLAVDKGNAAALVSFLVFDAIADTKIRKHEPEGLTMDG